MSGRGLNLVILLFILPYLLPILLTHIGSKTREYTTSSIDNFIMRPVKELSYIGIIGAVFSGGCLLGCIYGNQLTAFTGGGFGIFMFMSLLMILVPCPHFWDVYVNGDTVVSYRFFIRWSTTKISDIDHCIQNRGGLHAYNKNNRKLFSIDGYSINIDNFERRMDQEGIEIIVKSPVTGRDY